jgi:hypothetical protein
MSITEAVRRLFNGSTIERATVDLAQSVTEVQPAAYLRADHQGRRSQDLSKAQLAKLRKLNPAFKRAEEVAQANTRDIAAQRRRHRLDEVV